DELPVGCEEEELERHRNPGGRRDGGRRRRRRGRRRGRLVANLRLTAAAGGEESHSDGEERASHEWEFLTTRAEPCVCRHPPRVIARPRMTRLGLRAFPLVALTFVLAGCGGNQNT